VTGDQNKGIDNETYNHELMRDFKLPKGEIMLGRIRYFSNGMVIGLNPPSKRKMMRATTGGRPYDLQFSPVIQSFNFLFL
jgi:hypothetical protein